MRNPNGKKRCQSTSPQLHLRCTKDRDHEAVEIDVVHKSGMFIWRTTGAQRDLKLDKISSLRIGGTLIDPTMISDVKFTLPLMPDLGRLFLNDVKRGLEEADCQAEPQPVDAPFDDSTCDCPQCQVLGPDEVTASPEHQLHEWWIQQAEDECARTIPKAVEYSAVDLTDIGHDLARTMGREVSDEEAAELGVFFYLRGKVARWVGAVTAGQRVSDDTLFDIGVYVRMAQRIREFGSWPGTEEPVEAGTDSRKHNCGSITCEECRS